VISHALRSAAAGLWLCFASGCVFPIVDTYYEPHGTGEVYSGAGTCGLSLAKQMHFKLEDGAVVIIQADLSKDKATKSMHTNPLFIGLRPQGLETLSFESTSMTVSSKSLRDPKVISIGPARTNNYGPDYYPSLPLDSPEAFSVTLPPLLYRGQRVQLDPVRFTVRTGPGVADCGAG
jgi:hypothetical protein